MAKFYGTIGYVERVEKEPGIWEDEVTERKYYGELTRNRRNFQTSGSINDNINVSNEISIVADPYAYQNFHHMGYVDFMGTKWVIQSVDVQYPRLILTIGGVYNG